MLSYIARRALLAIVTLWFVSIVSFFVMILPPGDFVSSYVLKMRQQGTIIGEETAENMRLRWGLDKPVYVQYVKWMGRVLQGDLGNSLQWNNSVLDLIADRLALTMVLSIAAELLAWAVALPIGIYSAVRQYSIGDYIFTVIGFIGVAVPSFLLALVVMYCGFVWFHMEIGGLFSPDYVAAPWSWDKVWNLIKHLPVPAVVLGLAGTAQMIRIMRANLLDELRKPYVITARAKGLPERRLILKYPVRVALNPFASTIGYLLPYIVSGSIIISMVMSLPTVGPMLLEALMRQDMFLAGGIILLLSSLTVIGTFLSDLLLMWIDPRIRVEARQ